MDVITEINFVVVTVPLPLSILFQEHLSGCWVTQIFQDGNAVMGGGVEGGGDQGGDRVEVGDQLASINGRSTINMKVERCLQCHIIGAKPGQDRVDLRYVGPLRPLSSDALSMGYEVKDVTIKTAGGGNGDHKQQKSKRHSMGELRGLSRGLSSNQSPPSLLRHNRGNGGTLAAAAEGVLKYPGEMRYQISKRERSDPSLEVGGTLAEDPSDPILLRCK